MKKIRNAKSKQLRNAVEQNKPFSLFNETLTFKLVVASTLVCTTNTKLLGMLETRDVFNYAL